MVKSSWIHLCFDFVLGRNPAQSFLRALFAARLKPCSAIFCRTKRSSCLVRTVGTRYQEFAWYDCVSDGCAGLVDGSGEHEQPGAF